MDGEGGGQSVGRCRHARTYRLHPAGADCTDYRLKGLEYRPRTPSSVHRSFFVFVRRLPFPFAVHRSHFSVHGHRSPSTSPCSVHSLCAPLNVHRHRSRSPFAPAHIAVHRSVTFRSSPFTVHRPPPATVLKTFLNSVLSRHLGIENVL